MVIPQCREGARLNYWRCYTGDYIRDTLHLNMIQDGAYRRLLDSYYTTERPIPEDRVYDVTRANTADEKWAVDSVLKEFFKKTARGFVNLRARKEIAKYASVKEKRVTAGKQGGKASANARQMLSKCSDFATHPPTPNPHINTEPKTIGAKDAPFDLPDWIDSADWKDFEEMRRKLRRPMTNRARRGIVAKLQELSTQGHPVGKVLAQSIRNGWQDVFPLRETEKKYSNHGEAYVGSGPAIENSFCVTCGRTLTWHRRAEKGREPGFDGHAFVSEPEGIVA